MKPQQVELRQIFMPFRSLLHRMSVGSGRDFLWILVLAIGFVVVLSILGEPPSSVAQPASISVSIDLPTLIPKEATKVYASVQNTGKGIAKNVEITIESLCLASQRSSRVDIAGGQFLNIEIVLTADDVRNGFYDATVNWKYEDSTGAHNGGPLVKKLYVLPLVQLVEYEWERIWPYVIWGKSEMGKNDTTRFHFRIQSGGMVYYSNMYCVVNFTREALNMSIVPSIIEVEQLGPMGKSEDYVFTVKSANAKSGTYEVAIYLYSEGVYVRKHTAELKVVPG